MVTEFQAYVGPQPFEEKDKAIFFGRDFEARDLLSLVIAHNIVLVYAQSGAGKTSLINAGLIPLLKENQFEVFPVARVKGAPLKDMGAVEISNIFVFNALTSMVEAGYDVERLSKTKLVDFLNSQEHMQDNEGMPLPRAVIFDQFEEIFSLYQDRWKDREGFFEQVSDALEADPLLRIVFVMREDFIAQLDPYAYLLPERLRTRFHMERMRREAALRAVKCPLRGTDRFFAEGVAEKLVDDLLTIQVETTPSKTEEVTGEFIEAVQLQVVCQNLWEELPPDEKLITFQHLKTYGNVEQELSLFYDGAIKAAAEKAHIEEDVLRTLFGRVLITTMGTRGMVYRAKESTAGIPNAAIDVLESMHLIRAEWRAGARWYELTHDRFIKSIQLSNKVFNDKLAEKKRKEKEQEREQEEKKEREEKKKRTRNLIIKGLAAFSIIFLILSGFALYQWYKVEEQKEMLEKQKEMLEEQKETLKEILKVTGFNSIGAAKITENQKQMLKEMLKGTGYNPIGVAITPNGKKVYVANNASNNVYVIDTVTNDITKKVDVGNGSYGVVVTPDGTKVYVAHLGRDLISVIDTTNNTIAGNISVDSPYGLEFVPNGTKLYVTNNFNSSVSVIDTATNIVTNIVPVESHPVGVVVTPDGREIYVTNNESNNVSVINTTTNTVTKKVSVGFNTQGIAIAPDGKNVYVASADYENGTVSVINTTTNTVTKNISVGRHPIGVAVTPDGTRVYVTNEWDWTVSVINTTTNTVTKNVSVGIMPFGVEVTADGTRVYVANEWDWTVSVIDTETNNVTDTVSLPSKNTIPIITWSNPTDITYKTELRNTQLNAVATDPDTRNAVPGNFIYTPSSGTILSAGKHTLHVDFTPINTAKYTSASKNVIINVKSIPEISWSKPDDISNRTSLNSTQLNAVATDPNNGNIVLGNYDYDPAEGTILDNGTHILKVYFTPEDAANYTNASKDVTINVLPMKVLLKTYAYITNFNDNSISVIDMETNAVNKTIKEGVGDGPCDIAVTPDGKKAYVTNRRSNTVSVIDIDTNTVKDTLKEGIGNGPYAVALTPDGKKAYVPNLRSNNVSVVDTATNTVTVTVPVGNSPTEVAFSPDGSKAYVTNDVDKTVSVVDTATNNVTSTVPVGDSPCGIAFSPDGSKAYVTNDRDKIVFVIDTDTDSVIEDVPINDNYPGAIAVNSAGTRAYVTSGSSNVISIIDTAANSVIGTEPVGIFPWGIAVSPDGSKVCVTNNGNSSVSIIDTITNDVFSVGVGKGPCGVAVTTDGAHV